MVVGFGDHIVLQLKLFKLLLDIFYWNIYDTHVNNIELHTNKYEIY